MELSPTDDSAAANLSGGTKVPLKDFDLSMTELVAQSSNMHHNKWCANKVTMKQCIASSVPDSVFNQVKMKSTAKDIWDTIAQIFEGHSLMVVINLRQKMQNVSCGASDNVCTHFDKLVDMNKKLSSIGVTLEDHEYALILIGSPVMASLMYE